nr:CDP-diacylglycerol--serine O-phosphatidyltransferase 2 isoform X3 [Ipomoea batatas]
MVANCNTNHSRVQYLLAGQKASKKGGIVLLAFPCYLHRRTPDLHKVWAWIVSRADAQMVGYILDIRRGWLYHILVNMVMAIDEEKAAMRVLARRSQIL